MAMWVLWVSWRGIGGRSARRASVLFKALGWLMPAKPLSVARDPVCGRALLCLMILWVLSARNLINVVAPGRWCGLKIHSGFRRTAFFERQAQAPGFQVRVRAGDGGADIA